MNAEQTSMNQLITDNIDIWTSKVKAKSASGRGSSKKRELYGVKKLRELILELAVRGKLVPQDPTDEPAAVLLERIAKEKAQLVKDKKIKRSKASPEVTKGDKPFELPIGWEFKRLSEIGIIFNGNSVNARLKEEKYIGLSVGLPFIATKDVGYGFDKLAYGNGVLIPFEEPKFKVARKNSVLMCAEGGSAGKKCGIATQDICFGNKLFAVEPYDRIEPKFILSFYLTPTFFKQFSASMTGIIGGISIAKFSDLVIPIPPIEEQYRIVSKVDELMALCDLLEQQTEASIEAHQVLVATLLYTLTSSADAEELMQNWARISDHFNILFTTDESIEQLKQTIVQLAVMGKLASQVSNDEPAANLLERIAVEKAQLIKDKKIKKQKALPPIADEEQLFVLPNGWEWCYLQDIFSVVTDGDHQAPPKAEGGIPFLVIGNLNTGNIRFENCKFVPVSYYRKLDWTRQPAKGDLLYTVTGSYGIPIIVSEDKPFCVQRHVAILNSTIYTPTEFIRYVLLSKYSFDYATSVATGIAQKTVPLTGLRRMPVPLPPAKETRVILEKIDRMMNICDQLQASLKLSHINKLHLTNAIVDLAL